jgi:hypothetical protein
MGSGADKVIGHGDSLLFVSARVGLLATLSAVARLFIVLLLDSDAAFNREGVSADIYLVVHLIGGSTLVTGADCVDLVKLIGNLLVVGFSDSE